MLRGAVNQSYEPYYAMSYDLKVFWMWMLNSIYHSVALYYLSLLMVSPDATLPSGQTSGYLYLGNCVFTVSLTLPCHCKLNSIFINYEFPINTCMSSFQSLLWRRLFYQKVISVLIFYFIICSLL